MASTWNHVGACPNCGGPIFLKQEDSEGLPVYRTCPASCKYSPLNEGYKQAKRQSNTSSDSIAHYPV